MTRGKQIIEEAKRIIAEAHERGDNDPMMDLAITLYFSLGARWADQHPDIDVRTMAAWQSGYDEGIAKYRWISVEDELPPYNKNVLVYDAEHPYFEFWWARRYAKGSGRLLDKNGFTTLTDEVNVTHWMYINPPIPNPNLEDNSKKGGEK